MSQKILHIGDQMMELLHHLEAMCCSSSALLLQVDQVWSIHGLGQDQKGVAEVEIISIDENLSVNALGIHHSMIELRFVGREDSVFVPLLNFALLKRELVS